MSASNELSRFETAAMVALLTHQLRDGYVRVRSRDERILLKKAVGLGLVDPDGSVTPSGDRLRASWASPSASTASD